VTEYNGSVEVVPAERVALLSVEEKEKLVEMLERVGISCRSAGGRS
jgi:hypothetical protein